jgi:hypothetical protein
MKINGTYIDQVELMEYYRMSSACEVTRYKRMLWASSAYAKHAGISSTPAYKALSHILGN